MSSEGMDIPALNTLMLISSKSDIQQSIGRILRKNHGVNNAIIYDIVDNFSVFGNQGVKRLKFYQKNNFTVYTNSVIDDNIENITEVSDKALTNFIVKKIKPKTTKLKKGVCVLD